MRVSPNPPLTPAAEVLERMRVDGYAVLDRAAVGSIAGCDEAALAALWAAAVLTLVTGWDYLRVGLKHMDS